MIHIVTFYTTHGAIGAEKAVLHTGKCRLVSIPPSITSGCGLALLVEDSFIKEALQLLQEKDIPYSGVYEKVGIQEYRDVGGSHDLSG